MSEFEIIETTKVKPLAIYNGYQFRKYRQNENGTVWVCLNEKKEKCKGRMRVKNGEIIDFAEHLCKPDVAACEVKKHFDNARKRVREESSLTSSHIFRQEMSPLFQKGYDHVTNIPTYASAKTTLNRIKKRTLGYTLDPNSKEEIIVPDDISQFGNDYQFLLFDDNVEERIIAFSSSAGREAASTYKHFFFDGTFKSCSKQFLQIYSIHVDIGSTSSETNVIPIIFALLPNKTKIIYTRLFKLIKEHIPNFNPNTITIDFETATIQAIKDVFPNTQISGCNYHFNQSLWRKVQDIGLVEEYRDNEEIRLNIRMCSALSLIPLQNIDEGWLIIMENSPNNEKLKIFHDYFVEQWLDNATITKDIWNCYLRRHRTNNVVEGWNSRLNKEINRPRPTFIVLYKCLKFEAEHADLLLNRQYLNLEGKKRKKCYMELDNRIDKTIKSFEEDKDLYKCLKILSYVQKLAQ